ncbi:diguanylate cyclase domain-containing protein [Legionella yabuuchiae]|uniref:diguanylate cyclase domain-containing protein n=1 Tax=Legionella yabuuchiae TaxID=376727 RepID=UPI0010559519|nr:GGDEF domain-containing protein [Legionella yabuuchiae]
MSKTRLSTFILNNIETITQEWENFARSIFPADKSGQIKLLRDHVEGMLKEVAEDLQQWQSKSEQVVKSKGQKTQDEEESAAEIHGFKRFEEGLNINEMISEYRALRASVTRLWGRTVKNMQSTDFGDLVRFNEAIDEALYESVTSYTYTKEQESRLLESMLSSSHDLRYLLDTEGQILYISKKISNLYEKHGSKIPDKPVYHFAMPPAAEIKRQVEKIIKTKKPSRGEFMLTTPLGSDYYFEYIYAPVFDEKGEIEAISAASHDITERHITKTKIWKNANYDYLTGLANRHLFHDRLKQALKLSKRTKNSFALLFIDLDDFKKVNDDLGHDTGDRLLKQAASRIKSCVRAIDTVARMGGDEFTVILTEVDDDEQAKLVADKIRTKLEKPFKIKKNTICLTGSIGIARSPQDSTDPDTLLKYADKAMYEAKQEENNRLKSS